MVKVKIIKLPEGIRQDDKYVKLGQEYEAFELRDEESESDFYKHFYVLNIGCGTFCISPEDVEIVEETKEIPDELDAIKMFDNRIKTNRFISINLENDKILLIEDGSIDERSRMILDNLFINYIVYRKGANKPEWL